MENWLKRNDIMDMLSKKDRETFYLDVRDLREDLEFFSLYIKRNKKSKFNFNISFTKGADFNFLTHLYTRSYGYHNSDLESLYAEHLLAGHFFMTLYDEESEVVYTNDDLKSIYNHFLYLHEIKLENYVSDFIGCSRGCADVTSKIYELMKGENNE